MEDSQIVELYLSRDESAVARTGEKYGSRLRAIAHRITEDPGAAEECENDTYLAAWNAIPPHEPRSYLFAFLARITRHLSLNLCRERGALKRSAHILELTGELGQCLATPEDVQQELDAMGGLRSSTVWKGPRRGICTTRKRAGSPLRREAPG